MKKKTLLILLILILLSTNIIAITATDNNIYKLEIEKTNKSFLSSDYEIYYIYESELEKLDNGEQNIIVYENLSDFKNDEYLNLRNIDLKAKIKTSFLTNDVEDYIKSSENKAYMGLINSFGTLIGLLMLGFSLIFMVTFFTKQRTG